MIVTLRWMIPSYNAIVSIEIRADTLPEAGLKAARALRELARPEERTVPIYPQEPTVQKDRP